MENLKTSWSLKVTKSKYGNLVIGGNVIGDMVVEVVMVVRRMLLRMVKVVVRNMLVGMKGVKG